MKKVKNITINFNKLEEKRGYEVVCKWMIGDAGGTDITTIGTFKATELSKLADCIETCERMKNAFNNVNRDYGSYVFVEGYEVWFSPYSDKADKRASYVPTEPYDDCEDRFEDYEVYYYDTCGIKAKCDIEFIEEED